MEDESSSATFKLGIALVVLFFVSWFQSCEELRYRMSGKKATATVTNIAELVDKYGRRTGDAKMWYEFANDNTKRRASGSVSLRADEAQDYYVGQSMPIEYIGDEMVSSRLEGRTNLVWAALFVGSLAASVGCFVVLTIAYNRKARAPRRRYR